jgi:hypothetical protein
MLNNNSQKENIYFVKKRKLVKASRASNFDGADDTLLNDYTQVSIHVPKSRDDTHNRTTSHHQWDASTLYVVRQSIP